MALDDEAPAERAGALANLTRDHLLLCLVCTLGFAVDIGEISIATALGAIFSVPTTAGAASTFALSALLSSTYVGATFGALGFGMFARRTSTSVALSLAMALLGLASLGGVFAPGLGTLTLMRGLSGLAIGAFPPLAIAAMATQLPARWRASLTLAVTAIGGLGGPMTIYAVRQFTQYPLGGFAGWQIVLLGCAIAAFAVSAGFFALRRLDRHSASRARPAPVERQAQTESSDRLTAQIILPLLYVLVNWAAVGFSLLSGAILIGKGFKLSETLLFATAIGLGPAAGTILSGAVIDRISRRDAVFWTLVVGAAALIAFGFANSLWIVGASSVIFGMALGLYMPVFSLYAAEFFPAAARAGAMTRLWAMNRISLAIAPLVLLPLLRGAGPLTLMLVLAGILTACAALIRFAPPGHAGKELL